MARTARNRRTVERRRPGVLDLLLMVSGASAVSLSDFQLVTSNSVNFGCILAYNAPILGCSTKDFTAGNTCSNGCVAGLQILEATLETVCDGVNAPDNSILGQALRGNLVDTVCPSGDGDSTTTSLKSKTSTVAIILTTSTEKSIPSLTRIPPTTTSSSDESETTTTDTPTELSTIIIETSSTAADPAPAQTSNSAERTTDTTGARQTAPSSADKPEATRGGGSPFDATANSSPHLIPAIAQQCVLAGVLGLLLLR